MKTDLILGIETSCDETAAAVVADGCEVRSNIVASQIAKHAPFGGVIPELAAREHLNNIQEVVSTALDEAGAKLADIGAVAVTNGPGLLPALLVGLNYAKGLAAANNLPLIGVNHFLAHIYGTFLEFGTDLLKNNETYPILALVVSGGHTSLVLINSDGGVEIIGGTIDDAAGEAFDFITQKVQHFYVDRQKMEVEKSQIYLNTISEMMHDMAHGRSIDSNFSYLKRNIPNLTQRQYRDEERAVFEYLVKLSKTELIKKFQTLI